MEKPKTQGLSILLLAAMMILANPVSAENYEEVNVSGVTVYVIMTVDSEYTSHENYAPKKGNPPSCFFELNDTARKILVKKLNSTGLNFSELQDIYDYELYELCSGPSPIKIYYPDGISIAYDGWFLIGRKEAIYNTYVPVENATKKISSVEDDIEVLMENISCFIENLTSEECEISSKMNELMRVVFVKNIDPPDITHGNFKSKDRYEELDDAYTKNLNKLVTRLHNPKNRFVGFKKSIEREDWEDIYKYYAIEGCTNRDTSDIIRYNEFPDILIMGEYPGLYILTDTITGIFSLLDFWRYYFEKKYIENASNLAEESNNFYENLTISKAKFVSDMTGENYSDRLKNLSNMREVIILSNDKKYQELYNEMKSLENFYNVWNAELESAKDNPHKPTYALFGDEVEKEINEFHSKIEEIRDNLEKAEQTNKDLKELYYSELGVALTEKAIYEADKNTRDAIDKAHKDNLIMAFLAFVTAILIIAFTLNLTIIQNASQMYGTPSILNYITNDKSFKLFFFALALMIIMGLIGLLGFKMSIFVIPFIFIICLILLYLQYQYTKRLINPLNVLKIITKEVIKENDEYIVNEKIKCIREIALKSNLEVAESSIKSLENIINAKIKETGENDEFDIYFGKVRSIHYLLDQLTTLGVIFAKDSVKQTLSISVVKSLFYIEMKILEENKFKEERENYSDYIIDMAQNIFKEIIRNRQLDAIKRSDISKLMISLFTFTYCFIEDMIPSYLFSVSNGDKILSKLNEGQIPQELKDAFKKGKIDLFDTVIVKKSVNNNYLIDGYLIENKENIIEIYKINETLESYVIKKIHLMRYIFMESEKIPQIALDKKEYNSLREGYKDYLNEIFGSCSRYYSIDDPIFKELSKLLTEIEQ